MIDADERRRLRHAVALHDGEAKPPPKLFRLRWERRAADDEGPTAPTKFAMHRAKPPPTFERRPMSGLFNGARELDGAPARRRVAFDCLAQRVEQARHRNDAVDAFAPHSVDQFTRAQVVLQEDLRADELRHEDGHELAEDVAERHEVQEAQGMKEALPTAIFIYLSFDGREIGEQVAMRKHDALRLGRCA